MSIHCFLEAFRRLMYETKIYKIGNVPVCETIPNFTTTIKAA
jgi:hypothetical protein